MLLPSVRFDANIFTLSLMMEMTILMVMTIMMLVTNDGDDDIIGACMKTPTNSACTSTDFGATDTLPDLLVGPS